jgi:hypothetical protein
LSCEPFFIRLRLIVSLQAHAINATRCNAAATVRALQRRGNSPRTALRVLPKSRNDGANGGVKISKDLKA